MKTSLPLIALVSLMSSLTATDVDSAKRNETLAPKPVAQEQVEKPLVDAGPSQPAAGSQQQFVTVPAADARIRLPKSRTKEKAPVDMTARPQPVRETATARVSTAQQPPAKFERKYATPTVTRIQEGMSEAGRVKTRKEKAKSKANVLERINRFVFRRNAAEPEPDVAPAGGGNPPVEGAGAPADSSDS